MYGTSTALAQIATTLTDAGLLIAAVIGSISVGMIALMGLGFLFRHVKKVIGRKF